MSKRTILFIHQAFPGQFGSLAASLANEGHRVAALAIQPQGKLPGVTQITYRPTRASSADGLPPLQQEVDVKLIRAESAHQAMKALKQEGLNPDVIYTHPGWGEAMYVRNVWPNARLVVYAEWFYNLHGQEVNFDPALPRLSEELELRLTLKNMPFLQALSDADAAIAPTHWQKSRFPAWAQEKIQVVPDGVNLAELALVRPRNLGIPSLGLRLTKGMPIVTYASRHLEPVRGFHYFMRSLPYVLQARPDAHVIVMGQDAGTNNVGYGADNPAGQSWRKTMEQELGDSVDWSRVHFLGMLERKLYLAMMKLSAAHVYLTTPFILSWSFLEAAAMGLPIVASDTAPVREMEGLSGLRFVKFDDPRSIAQGVVETLNQPQRDHAAANMEKMKAMDHRNCLPRARQILLGGAPTASNLSTAVGDIVFLED